VLLLKINNLWCITWVYLEIDLATYIFHYWMPWKLSATEEHNHLTTTNVVFLVFLKTLPDC